MFRGPPYSLTAGPAKGNHFDVEIRDRAGADPRPGVPACSVGSATVTDTTAGGAPTQGSEGRARRVGGWFRAAAVVAAVHVVLLLGVAGFYGLELSRGEGTSTTNVVLSLGLILVFALLLAVLARVWWVGSRRGLMPTLVWNALLVPVVIALFGAQDLVVAAGLLLLVVAGIGTAFAAVRSRRAEPRVEPRG